MKKAQYKYVWNRRKRLDKNGRGLIELRVYLDGKTHYLSTGVKVQKKQWKEKAGETRIVKHNNQVKLNHFLSQEKMKLENYEMYLLECGEVVTFQKLMDRWQTKESDLTFLDFVQWVIDNQARESSKKHYKSLLKKLKKFGRIERFADVTFENVQRFDRYLREKTNIKKQSSIYVIHKRLKALVNKAISYKHIKPSQNPYLTFKSDPGNTDTIRYLTSEQLHKIENKEMPLPRLEKVKDVFLFCCYSGLGFTDAQNLTQDNIKEFDGDKWIIARRQKTGFLFEVPVLPKAQEIIEKYKDVLDDNRLLPAITNQKTNAYLKEIAGLAGVDTHLTFYMARHTFATTVTLENNIPIETVSKMLGHGELRTTQVYAKVRREKIAKDMERLKNPE